MLQYSPPLNGTTTPDKNKTVIILIIFGVIVALFFISIFLLVLYCKYKKGRVHSENFRPPSEDQDLNPFIPGAPVSRDEHDQYREAFLQLGGNIPEDGADFENFRRQQGRRPIGQPFENIPLRDLNANRNMSPQDRSNLESSLSSSLLHPPNRSSQAQSESIQSNDEILNDSSDVLPPTASFDRAASVSATTAATATAAATATTVASANDDNADKLKSVTSKSKILLKRDSSSSKIIPKLPHELRLRSTN
ncbi:hypothetical protein HELRODRAFT_193235 [Helobdella robusta]|uniref:Uncharacterized protein n=1 Tax=Helobdella robusta TaxID=6412 RepID=T1FUS0_HELRO|nr:hypothetical protein HELRODRAFT_193235 [Helobdella robusta]ESN97530.1 hypothetical protein HELRODRAFT_193235 [Helobdella robusta]